MERKGEATKHQLAESFKELMLKGSFDKITIRMITEQAGVIRPTFYNYFQDKYEVMEWLLEEEVFRPVFEMVEDGMEREAIYLLFRKMEKDQQYYQKAFEVTGQNGFEEILAGKLRKLIRQMMKNHTSETGRSERYQYLSGISYTYGSQWLKILADQPGSTYERGRSTGILPVFDVPSDSGCGRTGGGLYRAGTDRGLTV